MGHEQEVVCFLMFGACYCSISQPTLTNITHKLLDSFQGEEMCSGGLLSSPHLGLSGGIPVAMWGVVSEEDTLWAAE